MLKVSQLDLGEEEVERLGRYLGSCDLSEMEVDLVASVRGSRIPNLVSIPLLNFTQLKVATSYLKLQHAVHDCLHYFMEQMFNPSCDLSHLALI